MAILRVPYVGGPLEYRDGEQAFEEFDTATDQLTAGTVFDWPQPRYRGETVVRVERYVLTRTGRAWTYQYEGTARRPVEPGDLPAIDRDVTTRVADGPCAGHLVVLMHMDVEHPETYNTVEYKKTRFGDRYAEGYTLRETPDGWRWHWTEPQP